MSWWVISNHRRQRISSSAVAHYLIVPIGKFGCQVLCLLSVKGKEEYFLRAEHLPRYPLSYLLDEVGSHHFQW